MLQEQPRNPSHCAIFFLLAFLLSFSIACIQSHWLGDTIGRGKGEGRIRGKGKRQEERSLSASGKHVIPVQFTSHADKSNSEQKYTLHNQESKGAFLFENVLLCREQHMSL